MWACFDVVESAVYRAASVPEFAKDGMLSPAEVLHMLYGSQVPTPFGRIVFDANRVNSFAPSIVVQVLPSNPTSEIVAPASVQSARIVYPMPTWDERTYKWYLIRGSEEKSAIAIAALCSFILITLIITVCRHRKGIYHSVSFHV